MNINQMFPNRFLKGEELNGPVTVKIVEVKQERAYSRWEGEREIYVLYCGNATRGVVLSKPLALSIAQALGENDTERWRGKAITLYPQPMKVAGRDLVVIRARAAEREPAKGNGTR